MDEITEWPEALEALLDRMGPSFVNKMGRRRLTSYVKGLLSNVVRKNGWQLAEQAGEDTPYAMQQFLYRGGWDPDDLMSRTRQYVSEALGDPDGVLVGDETGFLKKGTHSVGVQRQYTGTAGRIENAQVGVLLGYVSQHGRALLDRELYLPESWAEDAGRCEAAGVPEGTGFRSKPALMRTMVARALDEGVRARWVAGDAVYGNDPDLRSDLETRELGYVLGTALNHAEVPINMRLVPLTKVVAGLDPNRWQRHSAGAGSQGPRWYEWQLVMQSVTPCRGWRRGILVQRSLSDPTDVKVHRCFFPDETSLATLVRVAGCRWTIETDIEEAKGEVGLDHYEVRSWGGWYRHISLAMLAHAYLAVTKAKGEQAAEAAVKGGPTSKPTTMRAFKLSRGLSCP